MHCCAAVGAVRGSCAVPPAHRVPCCAVPSRASASQHAEWRAVGAPQCSTAQHLAHTVLLGVTATQSATFPLRSPAPWGGELEADEVGGDAWLALALLLHRALVSAVLPRLLPGGGSRLPAQPFQCIFSFSPTALPLVELASRDLTALLLADRSPGNVQTTSPCSVTCPPPRHVGPLTAVQTTVTPATA